ncbi:hypothetical protein GT360_06215 [Vibrio astriarenae]|uniref:DUF2384 domain-containing protein n=1 Tax=Vibrio astriarenae TaxID=1481923 RepID=A0A7Z2T2D9_9VIBR|nr:hypothetical protein [Vibrio astriarenae]QIA63129.1 hypothetical protein GT360_06215 [Vibrio astriarenae]
MDKTKQNATELLTQWGASAAQIESIFHLDSDDSLQTRVNLLFSISDCLHLLYRDENTRNRYMLAKNNGPYFEGRKPLEIIASGKMEDLTEVHARIRMMVCI